MRWFWRLTIGAIMMAGLTACTATDRLRADASMQGTTVYIVHGYRAAPDDHWFEWLADKIRAAGGDARVLALPQSDDPHPDRWQETLRREIPQLDGRTYIVAHSLGTLATLRFLNERDDADIAGLVLVSPFAEPLPAIPELDDFIARNRFDPTRIARIAPASTVILSTSDPLVPPDLSRALARSIGASVVEIADAGHFLASDGYESFPEVWTVLQAQALGARRPVS